jgi:hypothetical protein
MKKLFDLERAEALQMLGVLSKEELVQMAKEAVTEGCDSPAVIQLSICALNEVDEINTQFETMKSQCRKEAMTMLGALRFYAREISMLILSGAMSPREGSNMLWRAQINSKMETFHELDGFIYAASEMDDRPEDKALFEEGILKEAKRVIDTF